MSKVHAAIAKRFCGPQYATLFEVRNAAGFNGSSSADAVSMSLWPSRGLEILGFEVKTSRADWLRELKDPSKSAPVQRYCHRWVIAVDDASIVRDGELPPTWGLFALDGSGKLVQKVEPPLLTPEPLTPHFVACLLRRATEDVVAKRAVDEIVRERVDDLVASRRASSDIKTKYLQDEVAQLKRQIEEFERLSGVRIDRYPGAAKIGEAVRLVLNDGPAQTVMLERVRDQLARLTAGVDSALRDLHGVSAATEKSA